MTARARAAAAPQPRQRPAQRQRPAPAPRRAPAQRRRPAANAHRGWLWIPTVAVLLGGIVWVNVAKLQLTTQSSAVIERANSVQAETIRLNARLQQQDASVVELAGTRLNMHPAPGGQTPFPPVPEIPPR